MPQPITIENEALRIDVWPSLGGKVSSIIDKADRHELMFSYGATIPEEPQYDIPYPNSWYAGWDECFPAIAPSRYPRYPYDGIRVPDHGELWGMPATCTPAKGGITTVWRGLRFGYELMRRISLDGPSLIADYTLVNLAPFEFRFVWAQHGLIAMNQPVEFDLPGSPAFRWSHDSEGHELQKPFAWPTLADEGDFSRPISLPPNRGWKLFSVDPITTPIIARFPSRSRWLRLEYASPDGLPAYWGIWINTGGWGGHRHFALEPTTGRFDQIDRAVEDGSAGRIGGLGRIAWQVKWTVG